MRNGLRAFNNRHGVVTFRENVGRGRVHAAATTAAKGHTIHD